MLSMNIHIKIECEDAGDTRYVFNYTEINYLAQSDKI